MRKSGDKSCGGDRGCETKQIRQASWTAVFSLLPGVDCFLFHFTLYNSVEVLESRYRSLDTNPKCLAAFEWLLFTTMRFSSKFDRHGLTRTKRGLGEDAKTLVSEFEESIVQGNALLEKESVAACTVTWEHFFVNHSGILRVDTLLTNPN